MNETSSAGELRVRVDSVERDVGHIEQQVNAIRDAMATKGDLAGIKGDMAAILSRIDGLGAQQAAAGRPNYSLLVSIVGVAMVFLTMIGGFAYWPINSATNDLKLAVIALADKTVGLKQYEADNVLARTERQQLRTDLNITVQQQRYNADMARINEAIAVLQTSSLKRAEFEALHRDLENAIAAQHSTDSERFASLGSRINRMEAIELRQVPTRQSP